MRRVFVAIAAVLLLPAILAAQAQIAPLAGHKADEALMARIAAVVEPGAVLETPAIVFASVKPGAREDGLCVMAAEFARSDGTGFVTGQLVCLLGDPTHLTPANVLTVRLVVTEGGDRPQIKVALDTLANEGDEQLQLVRPPNADATQDIIHVPNVPPTVADAMLAVGAVRVGAVTSPRGLHVVIGLAAPGGQVAAFSMPTLTQLSERGIEWSEHAALP